MSALTSFGLFAVMAMVVCYPLESRSQWFALAFAGSCVLGDVADAARVDVDRVRAWYASRSGGAAVPWRLRAPPDTKIPDGRFLFRKRCMALGPDALVAARRMLVPPPPEVDPTTSPSGRRGRAERHARARAVGAAIRGRAD